MKRALHTALLVSAASPAAAAETVAHRTAVVGPKIAGAQTVWRRIGDIDLSAHRAVWATQKTRSADYEAKPSGPARIVSRPL